ncbi:MAG TPA: ornithine cyclodeaminase family protein [Caldimonas sp.]|nr:ornithine cyclodeaminase family protein [Caldimonas sp.]HEX2540758.1 ornithine cyclodeaminase family protein [Caldimonas sp.]
MNLLRIDAPTTRGALPFPALVDALRQAFTEGAEVPLRHAHAIGGGPDSVDPSHPAGTLLLMPAWRPGRRGGLKTVAIFPGNSASGLPTLHSTYLLFDAATGAPLALIDGDEITARRTAAASALAASFLAPADATRLVLVGAGRIAALMTAAMAAVRRIDEVAIWSRRPEAARALALRLAAGGIDARAATNLEDAVRRADIVSCATLSTAALVQGAWLRDGSHLDLIGSFTPQMRECDAACFARARVFVDTREALAKSGDVLEAMREGAFAEERLHGTLADLCTGRAAGRTGAAEVTLFKSVGTALEDLAAAEMVFEATRARPPAAPLS